MTCSKAAVHSTPIEGWRGGGRVLDERQRWASIGPFKNSASTPSVRARWSASFRALPPHGRARQYERARRHSQRGQRSKAGLSASPNEPNERDSGFSQACHGWLSAGRAAWPSLSCSPGWRSTVRCTGDHPSVSSAQRGAVSEVTQLPALPRSGTYALFFAT